LFGEKPGRGELLGKRLGRDRSDEKESQEKKAYVKD